MTRNIILLFYLMFAGCDLLDEDPPKIPTNIRGYFTVSPTTSDTTIDGTDTTITKYNPRIHITWEEPASDDIDEYHIFRSTDQGNSFDSLGTVPDHVNIFEDFSVAWLVTFGYKVRAKDESTNIGLFSDSVFIKCFKPGGNWSLGGYDSLQICIDPVTYSTPEMFQVIVSQTLVSVNDTAGIMDFPEIALDTNQWMGNGWMYYTYSVLEMAEDSSGYDTVTYANTIAPEYCTIDLSDPTSGSISFDSGKYETIQLVHTLMACNGDSLFP